MPLRHDPSKTADKIGRVKTLKEAKKRKAKIVYAVF